MTATFADVQGLLIDDLNASGLVTAGTKVPSNLKATLPFAQVRRIGGTDNWWEDRPLVDVYVFAASEGQAFDISEAIRQHVHAMSGRVYGGRLIDHVETDRAPMWADYANPDVERYVATYEFTARISQ